MRWLRTKWNSTLSCVFGFHGACDGRGMHRVPGEPVICHCDCHFKL